jgi:aminopeptidase N
MVGLEGFNDDATETKCISLFSIHILAASPAANTDEEVEVVRSLVAHEYFHNWSGDAGGVQPAWHVDARG